MKKTNDTTIQKITAILADLESKYGTIESLNVSRGNKKLKPNTTTAFIIWNIPAKTTCPYKTILCEKFCYADKAEKMYPDCLPSRQRNFSDSRKSDFADRMIYTILSIAKGTRKKHIIVRIHESGDFYNKSYTADWLYVMAVCAVDKRIKFIAYTKSFPYFDGVKLPKNFALRASVWSDTKPEHLETISRNDWNIYTAVDSFKKR